MSKKEMTISVVGGGASGVILTSQLVEKFPRAGGRRLRIILMEKSGRFGPGLAYSTPLASHIINMRAHTMGAKKEDPGHFSRWMTRHEASLQKEFPGFSAAGNDYPPRRIFGQYLEDLFRETLEKARRSSIEIQPLQGEVLDLMEKGSGKALVLKDGSVIPSDVIVLAPGNFPPTLFHDLKGAEGYFPYPWPASRLMENIPPDAPVCILGAGLSAIDTLFTLLENGHREKVFFLSRRGFLPKVQGPPADYNLRFVRLDRIEERTLPLEQMAGLFYQEVEAAEGRAIDWLRLFNPTGSMTHILQADIEKAQKGPLPYQAALGATEPIIGRLWSRLSMEDQCRFDRDFKTLWTVYRHPMPVVNAEKILAVLKSGQLDILSGCGCVRCCGSAPGFEIVLETRFGIPYELKTPFLINATGQGLDVTRSEDPLLRNLLARGFIQPHPGGGIQVDFETSQVFGQGGIPVPGVFAVGEITRGVHFFTNGVVPNMLAADRITD
ncbi:MAG: FAD/NAD(P)-binding protein, partial [Pseudomonadota bacterium]